eukprot:CAMPEP_0170738748 /NCGR_PEP_ID=MMETSP0437-20130122/4805_1 /TAXON_ID=0 /ORGANISM="Sexangularia sp." /LENGTH=136 /DNA_ID=CAMNT_0011077181 /DNA_START=267 /DNA_END=677 /DNA_ORIENTATION=+
MMKFLSVALLAATVSAIDLEEHHEAVVELDSFLRTAFTKVNAQVDNIEVGVDYIYHKMKNYETVDRVNRIDDAVKDIYAAVLFENNPTEGKIAYSELTGTSITSSTFSDARDTDSGDSKAHTSDWTDDDDEHKHEH